MNQTESYIGEIKLFAGNFAPVGWMFCEGQPLQMQEYAALYSILGNTYYGGDGRTTFALPDLRGRVPVGLANNIQRGKQFGTGTRTLSLINLPPHVHAIPNSGSTTATGDLAVYEGTADTSTASDAKSLATEGSSGSGRTAVTVSMLSTKEPTGLIANAVGNITAAVPPQTSPTGQGESFEIYQPSLGLNYIICVDGIYPQRP
jgi:microcystin-dependent protein